MGQKEDEELIKQALSELEELDKVREARRRNRGMDYYVPNAMQYKAHCSTARTICYIGGNRAGKSTFGAMEVCYHVTRNYPAWYPMARRFKRPIKVVISAVKFDTVDRVIEPKLAALLPRDYYKVIRTPQRYIRKIECMDGSRIDVLTGEMSNESYESADWDLAWEDEPQQRQKRQAIMRGLVDRNGFEIITFTPITEPWMKDEIVDREDGKNIAVFQVNIRDNKYSMDGTPILTEESIQRFEESLPEDIREARISGKFLHLRGQIYKEFCEHHIKDDLIYDGEPVIAVLDPHDRNPHHVIWAYIDRQDDIVVDFEYVGRLELDELARMVLKIEKERKYNVKKRFIDPNFGRKPFKTGSNFTVIQELARNKCYFYEANDNIELGHHLVRDYLHCNFDKEITMTNKPKLFFSRTGAHRTIKSMRNITYDEWVGKTQDLRDAKESERQLDTHGADCVRYLCISKPAYSLLMGKGVYGEELTTAPY